MADNIKKIKIEAIGLKDIKKELDDIKKSMEDVTDPSEMAKLTAEADRLESALEEVNDKVKEFGEESKDSLNGAGKSFSDLKSAISDLDFTAVQAGVDKFARASKNMTFSGAIKSLKLLGKSFLTLGKALLTNPLFLLAAVITGIVVAVYKFLDSIGVIQVAIDALMKPIRYLIDLFYSLTDAIGLTNEHATRAAEETAKAYEDAAESTKKSTDKTIQALDHQIKMAELNGESTVELERKKLIAQTETLEAEMDAAKARLEAAKMRGDLDDAEMKALEDKFHEYELAYGKIKNTIVEFETKVANDRKKELQAEQDEIERSNADKAAKAKAWREKQEAIRKEEAANRLAAQRLEEDLELQLMEEGDVKLLRQNQLMYERLIEDTKSNESLTAEEKARVIAQYETLAANKAAEIQNATREKEKLEAIQAQEELSAILYDLKTDEQQKVLDELDQYYEESIEKLREHLENDLITKEEFAEAEILLAQEKADKIEEIERKAEEAIRAEKQATLESNLDIAAAYAGAVNDLAGAIFEMSNDLGEQDSEEKEKRAKKQFNVQKALNLVMAGIDGARAITTSLAASPLAIGPIPNPAGIASLVAVAANTAATIAAIASKQYKGGGGITVKPTTSISTGGNSTPSRQAPIVNFQGTGGNNNNEVSAGGGNSNITIENNVSVSETEITDKQKTVHNLTKQSQL